MWPPIQVIGEEKKMLELVFRPLRGLHRKQRETMEPMKPKWTSTHVEVL